MPSPLHFISGGMTFGLFVNAHEYPNISDIRSKKVLKFSNLSKVHLSYSVSQNTQIKLDM